MKKIASIVPIENVNMLELWLRTLPVYVTTKEKESLKKLINVKRVVLWTEEDGFIVF